MDITDFLILSTIVTGLCTIPVYLYAVIDLVAIRAMMRYTHPQYHKEARGIARIWRQIHTTINLMSCICVLHFMFSMILILLYRVSLTMGIIAIVIGAIGIHTVRTLKKLEIEIDRCNNLTI